MSAPIPSRSRSLLNAPATKASAWSGPSSGAYLWFFRERLRFPQAWLLIPLGTVVIWLANVVRIAALVAIGTWVSADIAAGGFHSQAGWLAFNAVALGLVLVSRRMRFFAKDDQAVDRQAVVSPTVAALAPLLSIVAVTMITAAFSSGFDVYYPLRVVAAAGALVLLPRRLRRDPGASPHGRRSPWARHLRCLDGS